MMFQMVSLLKILSALNLSVYFFVYIDEIDFKVVTAEEADMEEFERLLEEYRRCVERFVKYKIENRSDAEDILQDVFISAYQKFATLKNKTLFQAWILSIARNKCSDYYRRMAENRTIPLDTLSESVLTTGIFGIHEKTVVEDTLDKIGDSEKQILYLYFYKNLSQQDISEKLKIPLGTVKSRLHYAKKNFKKYYPYSPDCNRVKGEKIMKKFPKLLPEYKIIESKAPPFSVIFEELPNWFIIPRIGEEISFASYDLPKRNITEKITLKATSPAVVHGIEGIEISACSDLKKDSSSHIYYTQLTDSHCRWLGESYTDKNGIKHLLTFLDGDKFISEWGFGEDNCGSETHLHSKGDIKRSGKRILTTDKKYLMDVVGRYYVEIRGTKYDTICLMEIFESGVATEHFIDEKGRTVLWRRWNRDDWAFSHYQKKWTEMLTDNDTVSINGQIYVHWYDDISDYIL